MTAGITWNWADWQRVIARSPLTYRQKVIVGVLATYADYSDGTNARVGMRALAEQCGIARFGEVAEAVNAAEQLGLIARTAKAAGTRPATYRMVTDSDVRAELRSAKHEHKHSVKHEHKDRGTGLLRSAISDVCVQRSPEQTKTGPKNKRGYVSTEGHLGPVVPAHPDSTQRSAAEWVQGKYGPRCSNPDHIDDPDPPPCRGCGRARLAYEAFASEQRKAHKADRDALRTNCADCDEAGWLLDAAKAAPLDPAVRCDHRNSRRAS